MIGKTISHYNIIEKIGAGGMGEVYKAEDTKLKRTVALKFLPSEYSSDIMAKERFIHEAQAASALDHPNICTIHEIGETEEGQSYIAMACYEGESLHSKIKDERLKIKEVVEYVVQIAKGLQKAHEAGIVHRDIKPANIMITKDETVKILDFGLAKLAGQTRLTKTGATVGTIAYMSPEQAKGEMVDHRTDVWSLGVVMYEMLSGQLPFAGEYEQAMVYSILNEEPERISNFNDDIPQELDEIISKCLSKNPEDRYSTIEELLIAFKPFSTEAAISVDESVSGILKRLWNKKKVRRISAISIAATILISLVVYFSFFAVPQRVDSIAILPFVNTTGDVEFEHLCTGIPEGVIRHLQKIIPDMRMYPFSTLLFRYKDKPIDPQIVAEELNVAAVLIGRLSLQEDDVVINVEIIEPREKSILLTREYKDKPNKAQEIETNIARDISVSENLRLELSDEVRERLLQIPRIDDLAYKYYQNGINFMYKRNLESLDRAVVYFEKALEIDSSFALAWSGLCDTYILQGTYTGVPSHKILPKSIYAAKKALELNPSIAESHTSMAAVYNSEGKFDQAEREFKKALEINPNHIQALHWLGYMLVENGRIKEAIKLYKRALEIDPFEPMISRSLADAYKADDQIEQAEKQYKKSIRLNPDHASSYSNYALLLSKLGRHEEAIQKARRAIQIDSLNITLIRNLSLVYKDAKEFEKAISVNKKVLIQIPKFAFGAHQSLGGIYYDMDKYEQSIDHYQQAILMDSLSHWGYNNLGFCYQIVGEYEKAVVQFQNAARFKPREERRHTNYARALHIIGRYDDAIEEYKKAFVLDPEKWMNIFLGYFYAGRFEDAIVYFEQNVDKSKMGGWDNYFVAIVYLFNRDYKKGIQNFKTFLEETKFEKGEYCNDLVFHNNKIGALSTKEYLKCIMEEAAGTNHRLAKLSYSKPINYAYIGDADKAFDVLNKISDAHIPSLAFYLRTPFFDNLKSDPRYDTLVKKLKLEKYIQN